MTMHRGIFIPEHEDLPTELAGLFAAMTADNQAKFFNAVEAATQLWPNQRIFQWRAMQDDITPEARAMLQEILDHTEKG